MSFQLATLVICKNGRATSWPRMEVSGNAMTGGQLISKGQGVRRPQLGEGTATVIETSYVELSGFEAQAEA